jgi:hypothetical protein
VWNQGLVIYILRTLEALTSVERSLILLHLWRVNLTIQGYVTIIGKLGE